MIQESMVSHQPISPLPINNGLNFDIHRSNAPQLGTVIHPPPCPPATSLSVPAVLSNLILPHVMLWNPLLQLEKQTCFHSECNGNLHTTSWKCGTGSLQPRVLHDIDYTILLVSAVWLCDNGHSISSIDERVLSAIYEKHGFQPFILLHKTGFTTNFIMTVVELIGEGISFSGVERIVCRKRRQYTATLSQMVLKVSASGAYSFATLMKAEPIQLIEHPLPSNDVFHKCFVVHFMKHKNAYNAHMNSIPTTDILSLDHTFKVPSNIGYCRPDQKWITLYSSMLVCMNAVGQVVGWQFTSTTSIDEVCALLLHIKSRTQNQQVQLFVDNCCTVRNKLQEIFGNNANIKLDVFHAIQRITKKLPKRHPFFYECKDDLKLIVRQPSDIGQQRKKDTASPECMLTNIKQF